MLDEGDIKSLEAVVDKAVEKQFEKRRRVDEETHFAQHAWLAAQIEREKERKERIEKAKATWLGWLLIAVTMGIGSSVWSHFKKLAGQD